MSCYKIGYTKKEAQGSLNRVKYPNRKYRRRNKNRKEVRFYKCVKCNMYHLTSKEEYEEDNLELINKNIFYEQIKQVIQVA